MFKEFLSPQKKEKKIRKPQLPVQENEKKVVETSRFNEMIDYYTAELKSRLQEIESLKVQNQILIQASVKSNEKVDELQREVKQLRVQMHAQQEMQKQQHKHKNE